MPPANKRSADNQTIQSIQLETIRSSPGYIGSKMSTDSFKVKIAGSKSYLLNNQKEIAEFCVVGVVENNYLNESTSFETKTIRLNQSWANNEKNPCWNEFINNFEKLGKQVLKDFNTPTAATVKFSQPVNGEQISFSRKAHMDLTKYGLAIADLEYANEANHLRRCTSF